MTIWKIRDPQAFPVEFRNALSQAPARVTVAAGLARWQAECERRRWGTFLRSCRDRHAPGLSEIAERWVAYTQILPDAKGFWSVVASWRKRDDGCRELERALYGDTHV